jgi:formate hydrogenlyase subunit 3/multisubunit Na+/H+ antiporter MnhD subunit
VDAPAVDLTPTLVTGAVPLWLALVVGAGFGVAGALSGEALQRIFYAHAETHLDPPAASIVVTSLLIAVMSMAGLFPSSVWIPVP